MTTGEKLDENSRVSNVSALLHLLNPKNTGGGEITIISDAIEILEEDGILLIEVDEKVGIITEEDYIKILSEDVSEIKQEKVEINVVC